MIQSDDPVWLSGETVRKTVRKIALGGRFCPDNQNKQGNPTKKIADCLLLKTPPSIEAERILADIPVLRQNPGKEGQRYRKPQCEREPLFQTGKEERCIAVQDQPGNG